MLKKILLCLLMLSISVCCQLQETHEDFINRIRNQDFNIVSRQTLDEGHRLFKLEAIDLKTGKNIVFKDILIYYASFTAICNSNPFIAVGDTLVKKRGEIIYRLNKKNCQCILILKEPADTKNNEDIDRFNSHGCD